MKKKIFLFLIFIFFIFPYKTVFAANVCKIGTSEYTKISSCITAADDNVQTTIVLLQDRVENINIPLGKNIILDLNGYTLRNSGNKTVIENRGILQITNGTVTTDAQSGMINIYKDAVLNISDGDYLAVYNRQVLYNNGGTVNISGTANLVSESDVRAVVHNLNNGIMNITGGNIISNNGYAVYNEKGTLNIGALDDQYDTTSPLIQGKTYGIVANSKYNVYDGTIKGATYHVGKTSNTGNTPTVSDDENETKVDGIEEYSEKRIGEEEIGGVLYKTFTYDLDPSSIIKITFDPNGGSVTPTSKKIIIGNPIGTLPKPIKADNIFDGWFTLSTGGDQITDNTKPSTNATYYAHWTYVDPNSVAYVEGHGLMSLTDALAIGGNIRLEKDVVVTTPLAMDVAANLNLNGHTITMDNNALTINNNVTIDDLSSSKNGKITSNTNFTVIVSSTGKLTHKGGTIEGLGYYGAIRNYGTLEINGGTVTNTSNMYAIYNDNNLIIQSGTVYSSNGTCVQVAANSTFEMNDGLLKTDGIMEQAVNLSENSITTINGGTIEAINDNGAGIGTFGGSTLTVNGGTIKGYDMALAGNGNENNGNVTITINDGTLISTHGVGMYLPQRNSITTINGGYISGTSGIEIRASQLIVNDGNIVGTADTYSITKKDSGTTSKGAAIAVSQHNTRLPIEVVINGGNFEGKVPVGEGNPQKNPQDAIDKVSITIHNGNFISTGDSVINVENPETIKNLVSGGTYTYDPSEYVKEGYGVVKIAPDKYEVTKIHNITIDQNGIEVVVVDKNKHPYKDTVKLTINNKKYYVVAIEIRDANGNKIEVNNNEFIMPDCDVNIKVTYKEVINPKTGDNIMIYQLILGLCILCFISVKLYLKRMIIRKQD